MCVFWDQAGTGVKMVEDGGGTSADSVPHLHHRNLVGTGMVLHHVSGELQLHLTTAGGRQFKSPILVGSTLMFVGCTSKSIFYLGSDWYFPHQILSGRSWGAHHCCCSAAQIVAEEQKYLYEPFELVTNTRRRLQATHFTHGVRRSWFMG